VEAGDNDKLARQALRPRSDYSVLLGGGGTYRLVFGAELVWAQRLFALVRFRARNGEFDVLLLFALTRDGDVTTTVWATIGQPQLSSVT
jgi:hypothetical protein